MGKVIELPCFTKLDIPSERVLNGAIDAGLKKVLVLGIEEDGELYAACSSADKVQVLYLIEMFKFKLLDGDYGDIGN